MRIHILGASGCGVSSIGSKTAEILSINNFDVDNFVWEDTEPMYQFRRSRSNRTRLLRNAVENEDNYVLSGSLCGWGDFLIPSFDIIAFVLAPTPVRLERLRNRQKEIFGEKNIAEGGALHDLHVDFIEWAASYDRPDFKKRSRSQHEAWIRRVGCKTIRLDGLAPVSFSAKIIVDEVKALDSNRT